MVTKKPLLVIFVLLIDRMPLPAAPAKRGRGRPVTYTERLLLKALVIMIIRRLYTAYSLLAFLAQESELTQQLRELLTEQGRFPSRRTWERRLAAFPDHLPGLISHLGQHLVALLLPWGEQNGIAALDSTPLRAKGGVWHKKDREAGIVPHPTIDTEAHWFKSGYHGWWYGWKLHLACAAAALWIPLAARLTVANVADNEIAPHLVADLPAVVRYILGDTHYNDPDLRRACEQEERWLIASTKEPMPVPTLAPRSANSFIACAPKPSNLSMACLRTSLDGAAKCLSPVCAVPNSLSSVLSCFTNWSYFINWRPPCP